MFLAQLFIYPVKSLRGIGLTNAAHDGLGLVGDRRFMVVDEHGEFLTQRVLPQMALISTALDRDWLTLSADGAGEIQIARAGEVNAPLRTVNVWKSTGLLAEDCGDAVAIWLGEFLGRPCRLVRAGPAFDRPVLKPGKARLGDRVSFADAYPFLVLSDASLVDLNDRLVARGEDALPLDRFRPNLVVSGCGAFAEDTWARVRIGSTVFRAGGPCVRCIITTTDQMTAERGKEPLRTLATYRRDPNDPTGVIFGQNYFPESEHGWIQVGDQVEGGPQRGHS